MSEKKINKKNQMDHLWLEKGKDRERKPGWGGSQASHLRARRPRRGPTFSKVRSEGWLSSPLLREERAGHHLTTWLL